MGISKRYSRQIELTDISITGQQKLQKAKILVIGAGGLGCPVLQILVASGVGTVGIVDGDLVDETNLHRQLLYTPDDCGKYKVDVAKAVLYKLNPEVQIDIYPLFIDENTIATIAKDYEILVDCTDNIAVRYLINDISLYYDKPMVYASIHKFEGQISVFNYQEGPSYRCLFPEKEGQNIPNCVTTGVLGVVPNTLGMMQANEVIKIILGLGEVASGKLIVYNALTLSLQAIELMKNEKQINIGIINGGHLANCNKTANSGIDKNTFFQLCSLGHHTIIDLREKHETPKLDIKDVVYVPFSELENHDLAFEKNHPLILVCQSGIRSQKALEYLLNLGFSNVVHLHRGVQSLHLHNI